MVVRVKNKIINVLPIIVLVAISLSFLWKFFLKGLIPFPGDLLVGAYYPWLESKWGYVVGVPVKNPLISDVYSQLYIWKSMVVSAISNFEWPLWNPTMYSGYPLLANFQSGFLNVLNIFPLIFGMVKGWGLMMWAQIIGSSLTMFALLKHYKYSTIACLTGAVIYAYGGFPIVWMEYATVGQAMVWIPLVLLVIESANFYWMPILFLFIVGAGHFQALLYTAIIAVCYFFFRHKNNLRKYFSKFAFAGVLSLGISAIQLLPTIELTAQGIRFGEKYIQAFNFGLAPVQQFITLLAPDFFGNPVTNNYWGSFNYENVIYYSGILSLIALVYFSFNWKRMGFEKFFLVMAILALLIGFDTPIGKSIYIFHFPGLSTSVAGRIGLVYALAVSVLAGHFVNEMDKLDRKALFKSFAFCISLLVIFGFILFGSRYLFMKEQYISQLSSNAIDMFVGMRNMALPVVTLSAFVFLLLFRKYSFTKWLLLLLTVGELFRFGWKYTTFTSPEFVYPKTSTTEFLKNDKSVFRVERERAEILPPNTWAAYGLQSASGYDPMAVADYVRSFNRDLNQEKNPGISRYSEVSHYDADALGNYNVKYLLVIKRDKEAKIPGDLINYKINDKEWSRVFQTPAVAVLLNSKYKERARILKIDGNDTEGNATITNYENNRVVVTFNNVNGDKLLLADTYYPGWIATINGKQTKIGSDIKPFRTVDIRGIKTGEVVFEYKPNSFRVGLWISIVSLIAWIGVFVFEKRGRNKSAI